MHTGALSIEGAYEKQSKLFKELIDINKGEKPIGKQPFLKNVRFLLDARIKVLNSFKSNIFPLKNLTPDTTSELTPHPTVLYTPK